ncbi:LuxR C-terminal-related transcriptional regulator [Herbivorax sp. ANBcel31]|uniref:response regulator transcription factor n=1 Tax=Herbivorax sp. ANBcel31 TaxID=3069754 RepID=UPI0027B071C5|nr:LuxR C-terminal-related transcriptional regulator [Herbivorax sp. ANBcel31]MDQ2086090.1 LuxR C-terminal-related transcriptional regulator [Herbivorax sp. ANBcel31]
MIEELGPRELEILDLISKGLSNQDICEKLFVSLGTVKWHTINIYGKLGVKGRTQAIALSRKSNILSF